MISLEQARTVVECTPQGCSVSFWASGDPSAAAHELFRHARGFGVELHRSGPILTRVDGSKIIVRRLSDMPPRRGKKG